MKQIAVGWFDLLFFFYFLTGGKIHSFTSTLIIIHHHSCSAYNLYTRASFYQLGIDMTRWLFVIILMTMLLTTQAISLPVTEAEPSSETLIQPVYPYSNDTEPELGYTLINPVWSNTTYLINNSGEVMRTWQSEYLPGLIGYIREDGKLIRASDTRDGVWGKGGGVELFDWEGNLIWNYTFPGFEQATHHDIEPMPNGNVLMIYKENKTLEDMIAAGRDPALIYNDQVRTESIIEVEPTGPNSGRIVWEWHAWDHLIQDHDPTKANYGNVSKHPERLNLNYPPLKISDWIHANTIKYNADLDQIMISSRHFSEFWIIDHSTTTQEAAGETGGLRGKGGGLLYRWGNPAAYDCGNGSDQRLFSQHDSQWIPEGCPGEGKIIVFNNGNDRPGKERSSIEVVVPPLDMYGNYTRTTAAFGPKEANWSYMMDIFSGFISGVQRLPNGNTLICCGPQGYLYEVDDQKQKVWEWTNPFHDTGFNNRVFKARRYYPPAVEPIPTVKVLEDVPYEIDLTPYISDPDTAVKYLQLLSSNPHVEIDDMTLRLLYSNKVSTDIIKVEVRDGIFNTSFELSVEVEFVDDPPVIAPVPTQYCVEDVTHIIYLRSFVLDIDTPWDQLILETDSIYAQVEGLKLFLTYPEGVLTDTVYVKVLDGNNSVNLSFDVVVGQLNDPPVIMDIPTQNCTEDEAHILDLGPYINDTDTDLDELVLSVTSTYVTVNGLVLTMEYPEGVLSDIINVSIVDGVNVSYVEIAVVVQPVNDPPVLNFPPQVNATEDVTLSLNIYDMLDDPDTAGSDLSIQTDSMFGIVDGLFLHLVYPEGVLRDLVTIEVVDDEHIVKGELLVNIIAVNDPPVNLGFSMVRQSQFDRNITLVAHAASDPDSDDLEYLWDLGDGNTANGSIVEHEYALSDINRTYTVSLIVSDGELSSAQIDKQVDVIVAPPEPIIKDDEVKDNTSAPVGNTTEPEDNATTEDDGSVSNATYSMIVGATAVVIAVLAIMLVLVIVMDQVEKRTEVKKDKKGTR